MSLDLLNFYLRTVFGDDYGCFQMQFLCTDTYSLSVIS